MLKIDIEGGEFAFFESYWHDLQNVAAIVVEWHLEMGDVNKPIMGLRNAGFSCVHVSTDVDNRKVELYLRK